MAILHEKLAESLAALEAIQKQGAVAVRSADLSRTDRERLLKNGFLQKVMKGWYIAARPDQADGDSTAWYAAFWAFCSTYLNARFGDDWCLSAEQSLFLHAGTLTIPKQLLLKARNGRNKPTGLPHETSLFDLRAEPPPAEHRETFQNLNVYTLPASLVFSGPGLFINNPIEARAALALVADASDLLTILLQGGHSSIAGRLAGAFRNIAREQVADQILTTMQSAGYNVRETDSFSQPAPFAMSKRESSPSVVRLRLMLHEMRKDISSVFPSAPGDELDISDYMERVEKMYVADAYHSLSIEGYQVSAALIERVRSGDWNPYGKNEDRDHLSALAARGYYDAFQVVKGSVERVHRQEDPGKVAADDHAAWYAKLFGPSIAAGILKPADLAGYRSAPVYIRNSLHTPPSREAVRDMMPILFEILSDETDPAVRVVLGHFGFVYIHPYMDGNGRIGRFLMNVMLASAGYPWTVIPVERRTEYMQALETASVHQHIIPFATFLGGLVRDNLNEKTGATLPTGRVTSKDLI